MLSLRSTGNVRCAASRPGRRTGERGLRRAQGAQQELVGQISAACEVPGKANGRDQNRDRPGWAGVFQAQLINSTYAQGLRCRAGGSWCLCLTCAGLCSLCPYLLSRELLSLAVLPSSLQHQPWLFPTFPGDSLSLYRHPGPSWAHCPPARRFRAAWKALSAALGRYRRISALAVLAHAKKVQ